MKNYYLLPLIFIISFTNIFANDNINTNIDKIIDKQVNGTHYLEKLSLYEKLNKKESEVVMLGASITEYGKWNDLLNSTNIQNRGIAGDTTIGVLERINTIGQEVEKIFIMVGINDILRGRQVDELFSNYAKIVDILEEKDIKVYIQSILYVGKNIENYVVINQKVKEINRLLATLSEDKKIEYLDINILLSPNDFLESRFTLDGIHPNNDAYVIWAKRIKGLI